MQSLIRHRLTRGLVFAAQVFGLCAALYFYLLLRVRPELFYQQKPDVFLFDSYYFAAFLQQPGGLVEYVGAFLSPLFAFGWLGALVITLLTALVCLATRQFLAAITGTGGAALFLVPAILILTVLGQYNHPVRLCVGLCVVLMLAWGYVQIGRARSAVRFAVFVIASALAYYAAAGLYVVFAVMCGVFEWRVHRHRWLGAGCALSAVIVPMVAGVWLYDLGIEEAYRGILLPTERYWLAVPASAFWSRTVRAALLVFFPVAAMVVGWRRRPAGSPVGSGEPPSPSEPADDASAPANRPISCLRLALAWAALILLGMAADVFLFDVSTKNSLLVAYCAEREQWSDVLSHVRRLPPSDVWNVFQANRALYHRGELLDRMFAYPQVANSVPTLTLQFENVTATAQRAPLECSDILFELGRINESQHMAYEALEMFGDRPHTLKRLAYLHAVKDEPDAARRFLAVLECSLLERSWARDLLRQLDADPTLAGVPVVASRRELMVKQDFAGKLDLETMLGQLLKRNPRNRMAFEYLMAYYLLTQQLDKMVANVHRFEDFGETQLPRCCEEAILIYQDAPASKGVDLKGRQISPETRRRSAAFVEAARRFQSDPSAAFAALYREFGDSYFFFYVFGYNHPQLAPARPSR